MSAWKTRSEKIEGVFSEKGQIRFVIREEVQWGFMNLQDVVVSYEPLYGLLRRAYGDVSVGYRGAAWYNAWRYERRLWKLRKQYPHLSIEECEYSCAGAEFYMKLLKHQGFMIHASAVEKEGKALSFFGSERNREIYACAALAADVQRRTDSDH